MTMLLAAGITLSTLLSGEEYINPCENTALFTVMLICIIGLLLAAAYCFVTAFIMYRRKP